MRPHITDPLTVLDQQRTGRWREINTGGPTDPITRRYLTLYYDHGVDPVDAAYAYLILPGATRERTAALADEGRPGSIKITANSSAAQGVTVDRLRLLAANFWTAGSTDDIEVSGPASVLIRRTDDGTAVVCASDPTRSATGLTITWDHPLSTVNMAQLAVLRDRFGDHLTE